MIAETTKERYLHKQLLWVALAISSCLVTSCEQRDVHLAGEVTNSNSTAFPVVEAAGQSQGQDHHGSIEEAMAFAQKQYEARMRNPPTNQIHLPNYETGPGRPLPLFVNFYSIDPRFPKYLLCEYPVKENHYSQVDEPKWLKAALEQIRQTGPERFPPIDWVAVCIRNRAEHRDARTFEGSFKVGAIFKASKVFDSSDDLAQVVAHTPTEHHPFLFDQRQLAPREQQRWLIVEQHAATNQPGMSPH